MGGGGGGGAPRTTFISYSAKVRILIVFAGYQHDPDENFFRNLDQVIKLFQAAREIFNPLFSRCQLFNMITVIELTKSIGMSNPKGKVGLVLTYHNNRRPHDKGT